MRLLVQRVRSAEVVVEGACIGKIGSGLLVFLGIHKADTEKDVDYLIPKLVNLRIFSDSQGKMNKSLLEVQGAALVVSQFTLYGNCDTGRRPDFLASANRTVAEPLYEAFLRALSSFPITLATGKFGVHMEVALVNDGPVTMIIESRSFS